MVEVLRLDTPSLGDRSYLAHDGTVGVVVDPQRDTDRMAELARQAEVRITHVAETHIHNDYVSGGLGLASDHRAEYLVNADDPVSFPRTGVRGGDVVNISQDLRLRVVATPGHTYTHLAYVLEEGGTAAGVFTGGSLLFGSTGRPDLLGPANTGTLAVAQYESAQRLARDLPDSAQIYPTHGFGSFCAATQAQGIFSTIGQEKEVNPALTMKQQAYVDELLAGLDAFPAYYAHMGPANLDGPARPDLSAPRPAGAAQIRAAIEAGEWVVDLRDRLAFAAGFVRGTLSFPVNGSFASYLGWAMPWGTPVTLLGETSEQVAQAQRELVRIGIDRPAAAAGRPSDWSGGAPLSSLRLAKFTDLAQAASRPDVTVLDVRRQLEWEDGHVAGALHIPFSEMPARAGEVPEGQVWVYCHSGYRAMVAASMLAARGREVVSIDDDFAYAAAAGNQMARGRTPAPKETPR